MEANLVMVEQTGFESILGIEGHHPMEIMRRV
jgi:hypothetical protein